MEILRLTADHIDDMADVHLAAFPGSGLSVLGRETVRRYYAWQLLGPHDVVVCGACDGAFLLGFCCGGTFQGALSGFVRRNRAHLVGAVLRRPALLASSAVRRRARPAAVALWRARRPETAADVTAPPASPAFGILAVAVRPGSRRRGVGRALLEAAEVAALARGSRRMILTVATTNAAAFSFYEACGWQRTGPGALEKRLGP